MEILKFVSEFASQFEETDQSILKPETKFRDLEEWSSFLALSVIAMIDEEYNIKVKGDEIKSCITIEDLFEIVKSKI